MPRAFRFAALVFCIGLLMHTPGFAGPGSPIDSDTRQLLVVTTLGWDATDARLALYDRAEPGAPWQLRLLHLPPHLGGGRYPHQRLHSYGRDRSDRAAQIIGSKVESPACPAS
ncbi:MAG: hypothetical protein ABIK45_00425 [Pseudomonadota bacterium]